MSGWGNMEEASDLTSSMTEAWNQLLPEVNFRLILTPLLTNCSALSEALYLGWFLFLYLLVKKWPCQFGF